MKPQQTFIALFFIAYSAYGICAITTIDAQSSQNATRIESGPNRCPDAIDVDAADMTGRWHAIFGGAGNGSNAGKTANDPSNDALIELGPHPDYQGSLRGSVTRGNSTSPVAGDIEDGELLLEESANGKNITATWTGRVLESSCGQTIEGTWNDALTSTTRPFTLKWIASATQPAPDASAQRQPKGLVPPPAVQR
jgi:hypothetical protein